MKFEVYSIILGGTDSLLNVKLPYGYEFRKLNANVTPINNKIRNAEGNLLTQYRSSTLNDNINSPDFIFIYKCEYIEDNIDKEDKEDYLEKAFREVERIISLLQIFKRGQILFYQVFYGFNNNITDQTVLVDCNGYILERYLVSENEISDLEQFLSLDNNIAEKLNILISNYLNSTKFIDNFMQLQYLVTIGEMLVLNTDDGKRVPFSKRLSLLIEDTVEGKKSRYKELHKIYTLRSDWVHEGKEDGITVTEVSQLRYVIRQAIKIYITRMRIELNKTPAISFNEVKKLIVNEIVAEVKSLGDDFFKN